MPPPPQQLVRRAGRRCRVSTVPMWPPSPGQHSMYFDREEEFWWLHQLLVVVVVVDDVVVVVGYHEDIFATWLE